MMQIKSFLVPLDNNNIGIVFNKYISPSEFKQIRNCCRID
jgi:hypothetical protein